MSPTESERLVGCLVLIDGKICEKVPPAASIVDNWTTITCSEPIYGATVKVYAKENSSDFIAFKTIKVIYDKTKPKDCGAEGSEQQLTLHSAR